MLKTFIESQGDYDNSFRPAVMDSIRAVLQFYGLESAAQIYYNGESEITPLVGSDKSVGDRAVRYTDGIFRNKIFVKSTVTPSSFNTGDNNSRRMPTEKPAWSDDGELPLILYPEFEGRAVDCEITAFFNSRTPAQQFANRIKRLDSNQAVDFSFSPIVHYILNPEIIEFFKWVHARLAENDPSTPDILQWYENGCQRPSTVISNVAGNLRRNVFYYRFDGVGIQFQPVRELLSRRAEVFGKYEVVISYRFYFHEMIGWELKYPLNVYQSEIPQEFIPRRRKEFNREIYQRRSVAPEVGFAFDLGNPDKHSQTPYYVILPDHDPWKWKFQDWLQPILQVRLTVDQTDNQVLCNIFDDVPEYNWNPLVKQYVLRRHAEAFHHSYTPVLFQVYSNDQKVDPKYLSMDEKGSIRLSKPANLKNTYRVVVTMDWAIRDYSDALWEDLRKHREEAELIKEIFSFYDFDQWDDWMDHLDDIRQEIAKGWGRPGGNINTYMMRMGLNAFRFIQEA